MNFNIIEDALDIKEISLIHSFLYVESPKDWWAYVTGDTDNNGFLQTQEVAQIFSSNKGERDSMLHKAYTSFKQGEPSYSYSRQMGNYPGKWNYHAEGCDCFICKSYTEGIFKPGGEFETLVSKEVGKDIEIETFEWVRYSSNDFYGERKLNPGQYGFSLPVSDWNPLWGANLVGFKPDNTIFNFAQDFNALSLWDGKTAITPVIPGLLDDCYVLTGTLVTKA
jgi:hypothetical protein